MKITDTGALYMVHQYPAGYHLFDHFQILPEKDSALLFIQGVHIGGVNLIEFGRAWRAYQCEN